MPQATTTAPKDARPGRTESIAMYTVMQTIRQAELRLGTLFADGEVPGFIHLSVGQEAVPAGVTAALEPADTVASNHRGHGHAIAKGLDLDRFVMEIMGKDGGYCRGRGGSMHVADAKIGMLGANGIVGAGLPIALGSALAHQVKKNGAIAVVFFGDGALAEGAMHETFNLAALWKLPLVMVCENNGWAEFSPTAREFVAKLGDLAKAFNIPASLVDGNDVMAVYNATRKHATAARSGEGPQFIECKTQRVRGHFEGDQQKYRDPADIAAAAKADPMHKIEKDLADMQVSAAEIEKVKTDVAARVEKAITAGRNEPLPKFAEAFGDVYTPTARH